MNNELRFGIEIETVKRSRSTLAQAVVSVTGGTVQNDGYGARVTMTDGRMWNIVRDGSLSSDCSGEIVSPILTMADMDLLQNVVRALHACGARADSSCGIHIHVDGASFDAPKLVNLVNTVHKYEHLIERALGVSVTRKQTYCKSLRADFMERLPSRRTAVDMSQLRHAWYGYGGASASRYDATRYHGLNLNSLFYRGTIEFRYFNGTLHAGEVKAYVQLVLALATRALKVKCTSPKRRERDDQNEKWQVRVFLKSLGLIGPEFKTLRLHLTKGLQGKANRTKPVNPAPVEPPAFEGALVTFPQ